MYIKVIRGIVSYKHDGRSKDSVNIILANGAVHKLRNHYYTSHEVLYHPIIAGRKEEIWERSTFTCRRLRFFAHHIQSARMFRIAHNRIDAYWL